MARVAMTSLVFLLACGGIRPGLANDGMNGGQVQEGCDRDRSGAPCGGLGYDDVAIVVTGVALLTALLIPKLRR